ncbi:uncharacterized protein bicd1a [Garra rufa]|uniref:uncharacterized protein bicd1a n=1 Tax=Garra rufa TaxID=137080 RepID=UPI003CCE84B8
MAADGGCGESVDHYQAEVERLTRELAEANREKIRAAECGLVVLEENQTLKQQYLELETEQDALKQELEQLQEGTSGMDGLRREMLRVWVAALGSRHHHRAKVCGRIHRVDTPAAHEENRARQHHKTKTNSAGYLKHTSAHPCSLS